MIFINYFFFIVAKALPSIIIKFLSLRDLPRFSPIIIALPGVFCNTCLYSVIGSGLVIYSGLILKTYLERVINFIVNTVSYVISPFVPFIFISVSIYFISHDLFEDNFTINPSNFFGFDFKFSQDIIISSFVLPLLSKPLNRVYYSNSANTINNFNKELSKLTGGGYMSYKNVLSLGFLIELMDNYPLLLKQIENFTSNLEDNKTYTLLPVVRWIDDDKGLTQSITISESFKINKFVNINILAKNFQDAMYSANNKYSVGNFNAEFVLMYRV